MSEENQASSESADNQNQQGNENQSAEQQVSDQQFQWPDQWREQLSGGDEKLLKQLNEFTDPSGIYKSYRANLAKISSGEYKRVLPDNASAEEIAAYRKSHGIPEKVDDYKLDTSKLGEELDDGITSFVDTIRQTAYDLNLSPDKAQKILDAAISNRQAAIDSMAESDEADRVKGEDELRNMYGNEYRVNMNLKSALLDGESPEFKEAFENARLPDGTLFKNSPKVQDMMVRLARQINPVSAIMPQGASDPNTINDEIARLRALKNSDPKKYYGKETQERIIALTAARDRKAG